MINFTAQTIFDCNTKAIENLIKRRWGIDTISYSGKIASEFYEAIDALEADPECGKVKFVYDDNLKSLYMIHLMSGEKNRIFPVKYIEREMWDRGAMFGTYILKLHFYVGYNEDESLAYPIEVFAIDKEEKPHHFVNTKSQKIKVYHHGRLIFFL